MSQSEKPQATSLHLPGLSTIRFLLAAWVVFAHFGFFPSTLNNLISMGVPRWIIGIYTSTFNGVASVMAFFVVSGFCIHLPFASGRKLNLLSFYVRREMRILPPIIAMVGISFLLGNFFFLAGLWSLVCEEIYYAIYPFLKPIIQKFGYRNLLLATLGVWLVMIVLWPKAKFIIWEDGFSLTWLLCLPVWISGAMLAEQFDSIEKLDAIKKTDTTRHLYIWRFVILGGSISTNMLAFHAGVSQQVLMIPFGMLSAFWIGAEIKNALNKKPKMIFEKLGVVSYSLYLCHPAILRFITNSPKELSTWRWLEGLVGVAICTTVLYYIVEKPSHSLARTLSKSLSSKSA